VSTFRQALKACTSRRYNCELTHGEIFRGARRMNMVALSHRSRNDRPFTPERSPHQPLCTRLRLMLSSSARSTAVIRRDPRNGYAV
jgi:hypothetical protein